MNTPIDTEFDIARHAPWLRPIEWASYRPLKTYLVAVAILYVILRLVRLDNIPFIVGLLMVATFPLAVLMHCYLLRFVRFDVERLREFDPMLDGFGLLMPSGKIAFVELLGSIAFATSQLFVMGDILFSVPLVEFSTVAPEERSTVIYLYALLWLLNFTSALTVIFAIRLVRLLTRYAGRIRLSIFRYRIYSVFSGVFVLIFTGNVILACMTLILGPMLNFDGVTATYIWLILGIPVTLLVSVPIFRISRRMGRAKEAELRRIESLIDSETGKFPDALNPELEQLLTYERQVLDIWVWPFSTQIKQMLFFGLLPPISWLLGAFIEIAVEGSI